MRDLIQQGYIGQVLSVNMMLMGSGVLTRTADRTWQRDVTLGANTLTITFGHMLDAMCMVVGELTEVSAMVGTQVPQWFETDTKNMLMSPRPTTSWFRVGSKAVRSSMPMSAYIRTTAAATASRFTARMARCR